MKKIDIILSIGIIFKNEIRCLERCVQSLQPLRDAIPCQLVMADTGSDDGSREIAEKYADVFFDFPWINDFSAARNAVLDRCTGVWFMWMDADEWLETDIAELVDFLTQVENWNRYGAAYLTIRSYTTEALKEYSDFYTCRMFRNGEGIRFEGAIHEHMSKSVGPACALKNTILHHDGYIGFGQKQGQAKRKRNMELLEQQLEKDPENLLLLIQCFDSSLGDIHYIRRAVDSVEKKVPGWEQYGPIIYRNAVGSALKEEPSERKHWFQRARELFPTSPFIQIDVSYFQLFACGQEKRYAEAIQYGEEYLQAIAKYNAREIDPSTIIGGSLSMISPDKEMGVKIYLAEMFFQEKLYQKAIDILDTLPLDELQPKLEKVMLRILLNLQCQSDLDMGPRMLEIWTRFSEGEDSEQKITVFEAVAAECFTMDKRNAEIGEGCRHSYTAYLPLAGKCEIGDAAVMLEETDRCVLTEQLMKLDRWDKVSIYAIAHALEHGAQYPLPDRPLKIEELDTLAGRLRVVLGVPAKLGLMVATGDLEDWPTLAWARALLMAAIQSFDWDGEKESRVEQILVDAVRAEQGQKLLQAFANVEERFVTAYYHPQMLQEDTIWLLPPMHRFGWSYAQALHAKEQGNMTKYLAILKDCVEACPSMKAAVEFLLKDMEQTMERAEDVSPALQELANNIQGILASYPADDPAVKALKESSAYKKVAHLLEQPAPTRMLPREMASPEVEASFAVLEQDCKFSSLEQAYESVKSSFEGLRPDLQNGLEEYWTRYPLWGKSKEQVLDNIAQAFYNHWEDYSWMYHHLMDNRSRSTFLAVLQNWRHFSIEPLGQVIDKRYDDYFDLEVLHCDKNDVVVDVGAFIGDTFAYYVKNYGLNGYRRYYCYEITQDSHIRLLTIARRFPNMVCRRKGVGAEAGQMFLSENTDSSANTLENKGDNQVEIVALDDDIKEPITLLKMDIEGAEQSALRGCLKHIREDRPKLALSVYHNFEDIWKLARMVDKVAPGYQFYLRYHGGNLWPSEITLLGIPTTH